MESARRMVESNRPLPAGASRGPMSHPMPMPSSSRCGVALALLLLYLIWGSTYLAMRVALEGFPTFRMGAVRFLVAGAALFLLAKARGAPFPTPLQWRNCLLVGTLLLAVGNGGVAYAEQTVGSGLAALVVSAMPLWMAFFSGVFGKWPSAGDWAALGLGALGILLLHQGSDLHANPGGMLALLLASASWAFGSLWSRRLELPRGAMAAATQMLGGGAVLLGVSFLNREHFAAFPSGRALGALAYLVVFGSLLAFSAYLYLLGRVRPTVASSYAYINPLVAMLLGSAFGGEAVPPVAVLATPLILASVAVVLRPRGGAPSDNTLASTPAAPEAVRR
ncbi:MAG: drug/metabolite exporter YedA [Myxococcaceae bacterium]